MRFERKYISKDQNLCLISSQLYSFGFFQEYPLRKINSIYYGGFSSREQCNFDGQLEIMKEVMQITDRRKKNV